MQPVVVIISGPPCSGKTTLGCRIAAELRLPFIYKDGIKELLFDALGRRDRDWSRRLGQATYDILYHFSAALLTVSVSHIIEANFAPEFHTARLQQLQAEHPFRPCQIQCVTRGDVLVARFAARAESGSRHPGHDDRNNFTEFEEGLLKGRLEPLAIGGELIEVDTTDFDSIDYAGLLGRLRVLLAAQGAAAQST